MTQHSAQHLCTEESGPERGCGVPRHFMPAVTFGLSRNSHSNASHFEPARAAPALVVGRITKNDARQTKRHARPLGRSKASARSFSQRRSPGTFCYPQAVLITDPELAREVLHSPHLDKFRYLYSFLDPFLGGTNLLTGHTDAHWKAVRKGVAPAFSAGNMRCARRVPAG